jgi:hypothetical protein
MVVYQAKDSFDLLLVVNSVGRSAVSDETRTKRYPEAGENAGRVSF